MRIKAFISLLILSTLSISLYSQIEDTTTVIKDKFDKNAFIGVHYGWSMPMGSFSEPSNEDGGSAFAKNGSKLALIDFGYRFKKSFFVGLSYINLNNSVNEEELSRNLSNDEFLFTATASDYELRALMIGVGFTKSSRTADFDLRFNLGYGTTYLPSFNISQKDRLSGEVEELLFQAEKESGIGIGLNAGLRIHFNEYLDFTSNLSYVIFQKSFDEIETNSAANEASSASINYEVVSITFGLAYRFNILFHE
jgi:hypothetical protein